jgi:hypothetical protein
VTSARKRDAIRLVRDLSARRRVIDVQLRSLKLALKFRRIFANVMEQACGTGGMAHAEFRPVSRRDLSHRAKMRSERLPFFDGLAVN